jgi:hypothetical protein
MGRYLEFERRCSGRRGGAARPAVVQRPQYLTQSPFEPAPVAGPNHCLMPGSASAADEPQLPVAGVSHPPFPTDSTQLEVDFAW